MASPQPAQRIADSLKASARGAQGYLLRLEALNAAGSLSDRDVTRSYEGVFLSYYTNLERHIERLFMGLLMGRLEVSPPAARSLVEISSNTVARRVVAGGRRYADWLPINKTTDKAKIYLSEGRPFDRLMQVDREVLERMAVVRNAVAHRSSHATRQFQKRVIATTPVPPRQRTPAGYLRGQHAPNQTRLDYFMAQGVQAMDRLCS
jgi:hypothetical protein